jgi:hypothetical protein
MTDLATYHHFIDDQFTSASRDYFYLVDRHFPERGVLKLVGDRYRLTGDQRTVLYRGIASRKRSETRNALLVTDIVGKNLVIDGYNVLFTLLNYRLGKITFLSTDGILRDAGSLHGRLRDEKTFSSCISRLFEFLVIKKPARTDIYLDSPISHSEKHAYRMKERMEECGLTGDSHVIKSADWALRRGVDCTLATSDTGIIEKALLPVIDLPREILENAYQAEFLRLSGLLFPDQIQDTIDKS